MSTGCVCCVRYVPDLCSSKARALLVHIFPAGGAVNGMYAVRRFLADTTDIVVVVVVG